LRTGFLKKFKTIDDYNVDMITVFILYLYTPLSSENRIVNSLTKYGITNKIQHIMIIKQFQQLEN